MPHKRAKRSVRESLKSQKGVDLAPKHDLAAEAIPKSFARVVDAEKIRQAHRERKRKLEAGDESELPKGKKSRSEDRDKVSKKHQNSTLKIRPGESIIQFNRRVESEMVPVIKSALQSSSNQTRKVKNTKAQDKALDSNRNESFDISFSMPQSDNATVQRSRQSLLPGKGSKEVPEEFAKFSSSAPRRLNDIAQAPPDFTRLPRGAGQVKGTKTKTQGLLSMAQEQLMAEEREKAIKRYRELKASKAKLEVGKEDGTNNA